MYFLQITIAIYLKEIVQGFGVVFFHFLSPLSISFVFKGWVAELVTPKEQAYVHTSLKL